MPVLNYTGDLSAFEVPSPYFLTIADADWPVPFVLSGFRNTSGHSVVNGVSSGTGQTIAHKYRAIVSGPTSGFHGGTGAGDNSVTVVEIGNGGKGGDLFADALARAVTQHATYPTEFARRGSVQCIINDTNLGLAGSSRAWDLQVKSGFVSMRALYTGHGGELDYMVDVVPCANVPGNLYAADYAHHRRDMMADFADLTFDIGRYLRYKGALTDPAPNTADWLALRNGDFLYSYRGQGDSTTFAFNSLPWISGTVAPTDLNHPEGTIYFLMNPGVSVGAPYRKKGGVAVGSWQTVDVVHLSSHGNEVVAEAHALLQAALEGVGPPVVMPFVLSVPVDAEAGTVVGQLTVRGTADRFNIRNMDLTQNIQFRVNSSEQIVTTGETIPPGMHEIVVIAKNANGVCPMPGDIYATRPASQTAPILHELPATGVGISTRRKHTCVDGKACSMVLYATAAQITALSYMLLGKRTTAPATPLNFQVLATSGRPRFLLTDSAGTIVVNQTAAVAAAYVPDVPTWMFVSFNCATNERPGYMVSAAGKVSMALGAITNGNNILFETCDFSFLTNGAPVHASNGLNGQWTGEFGMLWFADEFVDWSDAANINLFCSDTGVPVVRDPYDPVDGVVADFELWGNLGDILRGSPDDSTDKLLSVSHIMKTMMA